MGCVRERERETTGERERERGGERENASRILTYLPTHTLTQLQTL